MKVWGGVVVGLWGGVVVVHLQNLGRSSAQALLNTPGLPPARNDCGHIVQMLSLTFTLLSTKNLVTLVPPVFLAGLWMAIGDS